MSGTAGLFSKRLRLRAYFENSAGLTVGAPVTFQGVTIGNVDRIRIVPERGPTPIEVRMKIAGEFGRALHTDSAATLSTAGVLGATFVDITSDNAKGPEPQDNAELKTTETPNIQDVIKTSQGTIQNVDVVLKKLNGIVDTIQSGQGSVGKIINDPALYNRANALLSQLQDLVNKVNSGNGSIGKLLNDTQLYDKINSDVDKLSKIIDEVDRGQGNLGKLLKDDSLYKKLDSGLSKANQILDDVNAGKGTIGKLAKDEALAKKIDDTIARLNSLVTKMDNGEGSVGKLFNDPSLYNNADQMLVEGRNLVAAVRQNPKKYLTIHLKLF
jgi:phospholipid/cholesterol/gamma-HCH transport system substrate-binding protein